MRAWRAFQKIFSELLTPPTKCRITRPGDELRKGFGRETALPRIDRSFQASRPHRKVVKTIPQPLKARQTVDQLEQTGWQAEKQDWEERAGEGGWSKALVETAEEGTGRVQEAVDKQHTGERFGKS